MVKSSSGVQDWYVLDTARDTYNPAQTRLVPDLTAADSNNSLYAIDMLSNGFKLRTSDNNMNQSTQTYIYAAFADQPFYYSAQPAAVASGVVSGAAFLMGMTF